MRRRSFLPPLPVALVVLACAALAHARVDVEVKNKARVRGSLVAGADVEVCRTEMPAGARYTAVLKRLTSGVDPDPRFIDFHVLRPGAEFGGFGQADRFGTKSVIRDRLVVATSTYTFEVESRTSEPGDYQLEIEWKTPRSERFESTLAEPLTSVVVSGERGGAFTILVKAAKGSGARPRVDRVSIVGGGTVASFVLPGNSGTQRHKVKVKDLPATADYTIDIRELATPDEPFSVIVKRKSPRSQRRTFDLRTPVTGPSRSGREFARGEFVDSDGGVVASTVDRAQIGGARVSALPGAVRDGTTLLITTAPPIEQVPIGASEPLSATVRFDVLGRRPREPLRYTLPFENAGLTGLESIRVAARDAEGRETRVPPTALTILGDEVSFDWPEPATFRVFGTTVVPQAEPGDLSGDGFPDLVVHTLRQNENVFNDIRVFYGGPGFGPATSDEPDAALVHTLFPSGDGRPIGTGDLNGDGVDDLAVWMPTLGEIHVHFGGPEFAGERALDGTADLVLTGPEDVFPSIFGSIATIGDVTGTAADDLIVRLKSQLPNSSASRTYRIEVYAGGSLFARTAERGPDVVLDGVAVDDEFGNALTTGDVTGDGRADLVVGTEDQHRVDVFFGGPTLAGRNSDGAEVTYTGEEGQTRFGNGVAVGDLTGDGVGDVIAIKSSGGFGRVYLFPGGAELTSTPAALAESVFLTNTDRTAPTFAERVAVGDVTGDGVDDLILKEGVVSGNGSRETVYVFRGGVDQFLRRLDTADFAIDGRPADRLGELLRVIDVDGDGERDLVFGAPDHDGAFESEGGVFVIPGGSGFAPYTDVFFGTPVLTGVRFGQNFGADAFSF